MENEVVIHVRAEDDTAAGFAKVKQSAKRSAEEIERDLKQHGLKAGRALADGIHDGFKQGAFRAKQAARTLGEDVEDILQKHGLLAGGELGQGVADGFQVSSSEVGTHVDALGADVEKKMGDAGRDGGKAFADGLKDGMSGGGGGGGESLAEKLIPDPAKIGGSAGKKVVKSLVDTIAGELVAAKNPAIAAGITAAMLTAVPLIGAALGAAVIGGGGALGLVGGFAAAAQHPQVKNAGKALGNIIKDDLKDATTSFVPAAEAAINQVTDAWKAILPDITSIFDQSTGFMEPFIKGVLDGVSAVVTGIEDAFDSGAVGQVMQGFGEAFRDIGEIIGEVFTDLSDNGGELADSLAVLVGVFGGLMDVMTWIIEASSTWIGQFPALGRSIEGAYEASMNWIDGLDGVKDRTEEVSIENGVWHDGIDETTDAINKQIEAMQNLASEMKKQTDPLYNLLAAQEDVNDAQKDYNDALKKHGPRSEEAKDALIKLGKATNGVADAAAKAVKDGLDVVTPAMRDMWRQAGLTDKQMEALEKQLRSAKKQANAWEGTFTQTYVIEQYVKNKGQNTIGGSGFSGLASGGIKGAANGSTSSGLTMVGEYGPELIDLPAGTRVSSNADTQRRLSQDTAYQGAAAAMQAFIKFDPSHANDLMRAIMKAMRLEIREQGGSVQTVLGTSSVG